MYNSNRSIFLNWSADTSHHFHINESGQNIVMEHVLSQTTAHISVCGHKNVELNVYKKVFFSTSYYQSSLLIMLMELPLTHSLSSLVYVVDRLLTTTLLCYHYLQACTCTAPAKSKHVFFSVI